MSFRDKLFGRPLASSEGQKEELSVVTGVPVLGLDALASTGYGPEAALTVLLPLGASGLHYYPFIVFAVIVQLTSLYFSYQQTAAAYPKGGGAYSVSKDNFGAKLGVWAAVSLLVDYLLNVAVAIAAGVGAVVSAVPFLHHYTLPLCLLVLATLTILNLRGIRESGIAFIAPVFLFAICLSIVILWGLIQVLANGGHPHPVVAPPPLPPPKESVSTWLLLGAFANGCTAMTGIEAVSNGVPLFKNPSVKNAQRTLTAIAGSLALFLLGIAFLCPAYGIGAMNEQEPGYQNILSQLVGAVFGHGVFYYIAATCIFVVLTYSAQTSFTDFPRVCHFLAEDGFLPPSFANRGRRLVYTHGILVLAGVSAALLIAFGGITDRLIPLFAIGAFGAFFFSQFGMVKHWLKRKSRGARQKIVFNSVGAVTTGLTLIIILVAKFKEGAWMTLLVVPLFALLLGRIRAHYETLRRRLSHARGLSLGKSNRPLSVVPISDWSCITENALRFALLISDEVRAVHISTEEDDPNKLREAWNANVGKAEAKLEILESPYRLVYEPILEFIDRLKSQNPDRVIAVIIPQLFEAHWYEAMLQNQHGKGLADRLYQKRDERTIVIPVPWYLNES